MREGWSDQPVHAEAESQGIVTSTRYVAGLRLGALYAPWTGWLAEVDDRIEHEASPTPLPTEAAAQEAAEAALRKILTDALGEPGP